MMRDDAVMRGVLQQPLASAELWRRRLDLPDNGQHLLLAGEAGGRIVALGGLHGYGNPRLSHTREVGMTVAAEAQGAGVGRALLDALLDLGDRFLGLRRIELTVYEDNERALRLYRDAGFEEEGRKRAFAFREGGYADVILMGRVP
jgi:putative acetyltransferase